MVCPLPLLPWTITSWTSLIGTLLHSIWPVQRSLPLCSSDLQSSSPSYSWRESDLTSSSVDMSHIYHIMALSFHHRLLKSAVSRAHVLLACCMALWMQVLYTSSGLGQETVSCEDRRQVVKLLPCDLVMPSEYSYSSSRRGATMPKNTPPTITSLNGQPSIGCASPLQCLHLKYGLGTFCEPSIICHCRKWHCYQHLRSRQWTALCWISWAHGR